MAASGRRRSSLARQRPIILLLIALFTCAGCSRQQVAEGRLRAAFLDLGQAEAIILQTADAAVLVDCGETDSGPAILRALRRRGIDRLDLVVLTHPHADHIGGFRYLAERLPVRIVLDPDYAAQSAVQSVTLRTIRRLGIERRRAVAGQTVRVGRHLVLSVLWPPRRHLSGTESDANNNSVVLMARHGTVRILLTGDLQREGELALMGRSADLRADVLKVGHQGSADAAGAPFLARVRPAWAVVIAGRNNSYGHPSPATVERLQAAGATVLRTDLQGEIEFESDGRTIRPLRTEGPAAGGQAAGRRERNKEITQRVSVDFVPGAGDQPAPGSISGLPRPASLAILSCGVEADQALGAVLTGLRGDAKIAIAAFPAVRRGFCRLLGDRLAVECQVSFTELTAPQAHYPLRPILVPAQYGARWSDTGPEKPVRIEPLELTEPPQLALRLAQSCASAVTVFGDSIWLMVLAGPASNDVVEAARIVKNAGGRVSAQDEPTSLIWDAPRAVLQAGLADETLPLWGVSGSLKAAEEG